MMHICMYLPFVLKTTMCLYHSVCIETLNMSGAEQALRDVLQMIAKEHGYNDRNTVIQPFSTGGANFSSNLYHITLTASGKNDLRLFAKVACVSESMRAQMPFQIFDIEAFFYNQLLKQYKDLEEKHNVSPQHRLATVKYYGGCQDYLKEVLVLENLAPDGFQLHDRLQSFDWEYAAKSTVELAKLHALSIALFEQHPDQISILSEKFKMAMSVDKMKEIMQSMANTVMAAVKDENKSRVQSFLLSLQDLEADHYHKVKRLPVIVHGDFRLSNLMHRNREDGEVEVVVLDYQTLRVSNPICDLMYFIFSGSDEKFREKHYHQLLDHYYKELCNVLTRLGIDAEKKYSREDFEFEIKEVQPFGFFMGLMILPMMTVEMEKAPDMSKSTGINDFMIKPNDLAVSRINGLVNDFIKLESDWGGTIALPDILPPSSSL